MKRREKINLMLEAVENGDFTFRYPEDKGRRGNRELNQAINRMAQIISETQQQIRQRELFYEQILQVVETGIIVLDERDVVVRHNQAASKLLGCDMMTHLRQLERFDSGLAAAVSVVSAVPSTVSISNERGRTRISVRVSRMEVGGQNLRIAALNNIENELDEKEVEAWIRLTRVLTHEIMNAVTPMISLCDTMLSGFSEQGDDIRAGLETIAKTGKGLLSFVEAYCQFSRLPTPEPAPFYVNGFLNRMLQFVLPVQPDSPPIQTECLVKPLDLQVFADEKLIGQVVINILKNACQAIGKERRDGKISVKAYEEADGAVRIEISNNGPRIDAEMADEIFLPFFTTKADGSGIGLAVSRQLMRLSGGFIELKSDEDETTFTLLFP